MWPNTGLSCVHAICAVSPRADGAPFLTYTGRMVFGIAIAACAFTLLGGLFALRLRDRLHLILGFSAGAVVGVAFFDLLPEALSLLGDTYAPGFGLTLAGCGFATYLIVDRIIILHHHQEAHEHDHTIRGSWGAGTLSLHSFLDGLGIGLAFHASTALGAVVAIAVLAHDFSDGINTVSMILRNGGTRARALWWLSADALAPALGILAASFVTVSDIQLGIMLSLFSGFFLYIGASDLLPESHHAHPVRWTTIATILGMATIFIVVSLIG